MFSNGSFRRAAIALSAAAIALTSLPALAQEISDTHLAAARKAVTAMNATDEFDGILPQAAQGLKNELIQRNPDMQEIIIQTVDEKTIALVPRRADLEREAALAYARMFTEEELNAIAEFYGSPAGQKLGTEGPIVARQLYEAADIWQRGVTRDLAQEVGRAIDQVIAARNPAAAGTAAEAGDDTPAATE